MRIDGEPRQKHIALIASYQPSKLDQISTRSIFWRHARERLERIGDQIMPDERSKIEAALAPRVPPTTAAEDAAMDRESEEALQRERAGSRVVVRVMARVR